MTARMVGILAAVVLIAAIICNAAVRKGDPHRVTLLTLYSDELSSAAHIVPTSVFNITALFLQAPTRRELQ
ncbi:MAG: hypothetical protein SVR04_18155 [Spirochaetota bacterium]|nr:hypothetical protein [Spirochaetota bacterium]